MQTAPVVFRVLIAVIWALFVTLRATEVRAFNCSAPAPVGTAAPCYVAFVHGAGTNDLAATDTGTTWSSQASGTSENYWWGNTHGTNANYSFTYRASGQHLGPGMGCEVRRIRYDGFQAFTNAASQVAAEFNDWFCQSPSPNQVVVVTHSMGGLVMRWLLNQGSNPQSGFYNPLWAEIGQRVRYVVTVQAPHTGSPGAAALWGSSSSDWQNAVGAAANFFGVRTRNEGYCSDEDINNCASWFMQPSVLEEASTATGWMGDSLRNKSLYTIAGDSVANSSTPIECPDDASEGEPDDDRLRNAWFVLFPGHTDGGDGLVDRGSAHGFNPSTNDWMPGVTTWIDMKANHHQGRHDDHVGCIWDRLNEQRYSDYPGTYIGHYGFNLPWSGENHVSR